MDYRKEYEKWLASPALSEDERAELKALEGNDKEIKARFYGRSSSAPQACAARCTRACTT